MSKIRYLSYNEVLDIYRENIRKFGGYGAVRDNNALISCIVNPHRTFAGQDLYPDISQKAGILTFSLIKNHPFVDGNKRTAFVCGRAFLRLNGYDVQSIEDYYHLICKIADGSAEKDDVFDWFLVSLRPLNGAQKVRRK